MSHVDKRHYNAAIATNVPIVSFYLKITNVVIVQTYTAYTDTSSNQRRELQRFLSTELTFA